MAMCVKAYVCEWGCIYIYMCVCVCVCVCVRMYYVCDDCEWL